MNYSKEVDLIIKEELKDLITKYKNKEDLFDSFKAQYYYSLYKEYMLKNENK